MDKYDGLREGIRPYLTEKRYQHTLRCCEMALRLADRWGCSRDDAARAALLHDITKKLSDQEQLKLCDKYGIINKYSEQEFGTLIHADTAAALAGVLSSACRGISAAPSRSTRWGLPT